MSTFLRKPPTCKVDAFRNACLTNGDAPECTCVVDESGAIHRDAFCPMVHESTDRHVLAPHALSGPGKFRGEF